jgi:hypothetical protein
MIAAVISGLTSPRMIWRISAIISSWKISRCSIVRCSASCGVIVMRALCRTPRQRLQRQAEEIAQQVVAMLGQDRLGMELHAFDRQRLVAQAHDLVDRAVRVLVHAVTSRQSGNDDCSTTSEW